MANENSWISGESLLTPDQYDLAALLVACNEGRLQICDEKKEKFIVPITQLTPLKRKFDLPTTFIIAVDYIGKERVESCCFSIPTDPIWKEIFELEKNCWQHFTLQSDKDWPPKWCFTIPEQLCDCQKIHTLNLREGEKYKLTFKERRSRLGLDVPLHPELCKIHGDSIWSRYEYFDTDRQMHIWFELLDEGRNIAWYVDIYDTTYRSVDLHNCSHKDETDAKSANYDLPGYVPKIHAVPTFNFRSQKKICPLEVCKIEVMKNCGTDDESEQIVNVDYAHNVTQLINLIMDTDYEYEYPYLSDDKYEPFIFDEKLYINRYYYFRHSKGHDEFLKKIKSFYYKPVAQEQAMGTITPINEPTDNCLEKQETKQLVEIKSQGDIGVSTRSIIRPSQLDLKTENLVEVKERIKKLREDCLEILRTRPNEVTVEILYYEVRAKGVSSINAARILYCTPEAKRHYEEKGFLGIDYKLGEIKGESKKECRDKILNVSRNTLASYGNFKKFNKNWKMKAKASEAPATDYIKILDNEHKK